MDIGQKLKHARTSAGLTQEGVAEALGVRPADHFQLGNRPDLPGYRQRHPAE